MLLCRRGGCYGRQLTTTERSSGSGWRQKGRTPRWPTPLPELHKPTFIQCYNPFSSLLYASACLTLKPYCRVRLSTVDLLVLTSLDQLLFILKKLLTSVTKLVTLMRRLTVLCLSFQLVFPALTYVSPRPMHGQTLANRTKPGLSFQQQMWPKCFWARNSWQESRVVRP